MRFANAMWDETARLNTVSSAGQMEAADDDILPAVPELNMPARHVKKYNPFPVLELHGLILTDLTGAILSAIKITSCHECPRSGEMTRPSLTLPDGSRRTERVYPTAHSVSNSISKLTLLMRML